MMTLNERNDCVTYNTNYNSKVCVLHKKIYSKFTVMKMDSECTFCPHLVSALSVLWLVVARCL